MNLKDFKGELYTDYSVRTIYSTDASEYKEMPLAVAIPKDQNDIKLLINYANEKKLSLIPRGAGTSLAGQVVGRGIVVDVSKYLNKLLEINTEQKWVRVQPGIVLKELNILLEKYNLMFGPETSSGDRCTIGGMVGNNSAGLHSLWYGTTRDNILEIKGFLSDGSFVEFKPLSKQEFFDKMKLNNLEGKLYRHIYNLLSNPENRKAIEQNFPEPEVKRRNTGYALDYLLNTEPFGGKNKFNFAQLIAGSEGTLMFFTELKLKLVDSFPKHRALIPVHLEKLSQAFEANLIALEFNPSAVELMDRTILELAQQNKEQRENSYFVKGTPGAILIVEFDSNDKDQIIRLAKAMEEKMRKHGLGYHFPIIWDDDISRVWDLRNAGLGVLPNLYGEAKPVGVIEDTSVNVKKLGNYVKDVDKILRKYNTSCVYYAHIGSGELHMRPVLNLRLEQDVKKFRLIATEVALLVKKYRGSLSGEHGDGRLRGEFIPLLFGYKVYSLFKAIKHTWDPQNIFNPGKIVDTPPMDKFLRVDPHTQMPKVKTVFDFQSQGGFIKALLKCNGSGQCIRKQIIGGTMCPSFKATEDPRFSTRSRANLLREIMIGKKSPDAFDHEELYQILDYCLMCKACKTECPSNVDMAKFKMEFLQHYYDQHHIPLRTWLIANLPIFNSIMLLFPSLANALTNNKLSKQILKLIGFAPQRQLPKLTDKPVKKWYKKHNPVHSAKKVYLFNDEFTNQYDSDIGIQAILLLEALGYQVIIPKHVISGRTYLSKGLIRQAQKIINKNISLLKDIITDQTPLVGIEPSAILTFRDEALDLAYPFLKNAAKKISQHTYTFEEFFVREIERGNIKADMFTDKPLKIKYHAHCFQKALSSPEFTEKMLSLPINYQVEQIPSGCCGMAGAFGYEKEHYDLSMRIGELVLFPAVRQKEPDTVIVAPGTSCRHHIQHGTGVRALHPVTVMFEALKSHHS